MDPNVVRTRTAAVNGIGLQVTEAGDPAAPPVVLSHGFPEGAFSWRHQLVPLAEAGFHAIAPDQRGYGRSSAPGQVEDYRVDHLAADLLGLLDETGHDQGVFVGHDWGALIVWDLARLHPERVRAVVGVSVPLVQWPGVPTEMMKAVYGDRFFYILYFQPVGPAEVELERDPRLTMARVLYGASGDGFGGLPADLPPAAGTGFLDLMSDPPEPLPEWLTWDDIDRYAEGFRASGFFGPLSYYRNLDADYALVKDLPADRLAMPSFFIGGDRDVVVASNPGAVDAMQAALPDFRGAVLLAGIGHWTQQEAPEAFNEALLGFLATRPATPAR
jgi:pimeloyl-ACP methyl ester carboxylesterase